MWSAPWFYLSAIAGSLALLQPTQAQTPPRPEQQTNAERSGTASEDGQSTTPPAEIRKTRKRPRREPSESSESRPPRTSPDSPPELLLERPAPNEPPAPTETVLDDLGEYGPAGDLAPEHPLFDQLTTEFNKAVAQCDLKTFLEVRERYIAEIRRILSNPNLSKEARAHFERVLNAVMETMVPIRAPMPCPILIR